MNINNSYIKKQFKTKDTAITYRKSFYKKYGYVPEIFFDVDKKVYIIIKPKNLVII
jgi:hypothetical protein